MLRSLTVCECDRVQFSRTPASESLRSGAAVKLFQGPAASRWGWNVRKGCRGTDRHDMRMQHAVTFAAGLAAEGMAPMCAIYSSFLQRGYDQIVHDVVLQKLPVRFAMDRAGLVGADGATHSGFADVTYMGVLPNMIMMAVRFRPPSPVARSPQSPALSVLGRVSIIETPDRLGSLGCTWKQGSFLNKESCTR